MCDFFPNEDDENWMFNDIFKCIFSKAEDFTVVVPWNALSYDYNNYNENAQVVCQYVLM